MQAAAERLGPGLQQEMCTSPAPLHLLLLDKTLGDNGIYGRLDEGRGYPLTRPGAFAVGNVLPPVASTPVRLAFFNPASLVEIQCCGITLFSPPHNSSCSPSMPRSASKSSTSRSSAETGNRATPHEQSRQLEIGDDDKEDCELI